jgi:hypothetical protein
MYKQNYSLDPQIEVRPILKSLAYLIITFFAYNCNFMDCTVV